MCMCMCVCAHTSAMDEKAFLGHEIPIRKSGQQVTWDTAQDTLDSLLCDIGAVASMLSLTL